MTSYLITIVMPALSLTIPTGKSFVIDQALDRTEINVKMVIVPSYDYGLRIKSKNYTIQVELCLTWQQIYTLPHLAANIYFASPGSKYILCLTWQQIYTLLHLAANIYFFDYNLQLQCLI